MPETMNVLKERLKQSRWFTPHPKRGFTLVEVTVVIAIVVIVMIVTLPAIQSAREDARRVQCKARMKQIGLALENYHGVHSVFPYASTSSFPVNQRITNVKHAWTEFLLPFLDEMPLYRHINFIESVDVGNNRELLEGIRLPAYACPSNPFTETFRTSSGANFRDWAVNHWGPGDGPTQGLAYPLCAGSILPDSLPPDCKAANSFCATEPILKNGESRWFYPHRVKSPAVYNRGITSVRLKDVLDGGSQTMAAGERNAEGCSLGGVFSWNAPIFFTGQKINSATRTSNPVDYAQNCGSSSHHPGGAHFLFVDGAVRFLSNQIDFQNYCYLGDMADGHKANFPDE